MPQCPIKIRGEKCIEAECAWWINQTAGCAIRAIATPNKLVDIIQETKNPIDTETMEVKE